MTPRTCSKCGKPGPLFGHAAICDSCRSALWAKQRERLESAEREIVAAKAAHPARYRRPSHHSCTAFCGHDKTWED